MTIGIDISQLAFENTGVEKYLKSFLSQLFKIDNDNQYLLFYSSLRKPLPVSFNYPNVKIKTFKLPPTALDFLWNRLHIMPIENFIGDVDVFLTSDWTEPPVKKAKKATILYDLIVYKYPEETHQKTEFNISKFIISPNIVELQKRKLNWVKKESSKILCISQSTKKDAEDLLGIDSSRLEVIGAGI